MTYSDTIADMLTRIRNAVRINAPRVDCRHSKICAGIAEVLKGEGFVNDYNVIDDGKQGILRVQLRYGQHGEPLIHTLERRSKPGRRIYTKVKDLPRPLGGLGIVVVSTPEGVLSDRQARQRRIGGELLCTVD